MFIQCLQCLCCLVQRLCFDGTVFVLCWCHVCVALVQCLCLHVYCHWHLYVMSVLSVCAANDMCKVLPVTSVCSLLPVTSVCAASDICLCCHWYLPVLPVVSVCDATGIWKLLHDTRHFVCMRVYGHSFGRWLLLQKFVSKWVSGGCQPSSCHSLWKVFTFKVFRDFPNVYCLTFMTIKTPFTWYLSLW